MNFFITGGTGFIGTHLTNLLNEMHPECKVYNLDIVEPGSINKAIEEKLASWATVKDYKPALKKGQHLGSTLIKCDVRKPIELPEGVTPTPDDIIFNFAAVHRTPGHPDIAYFETNIRGAENVTAFADKHGIRRMVFTSSIAPYGAAEQLKTEETLPTPNTPYGISKLVAEKIHIAWAAAGADRKLLIVRPGVVFGKGENGNFSRLYRGIKSGKFAYPGRKDTIKACIYVKELVRFMMWYVNHEHTRVDLFNMTFEPAYTIERICESMKTATGIHRHIIDIPNWLIMPAATVIGAMGAPMGICPARVKKLQISTNICGKKLAASGYKFKWTFDEALADWFEDNNRQCLQ